MIVNVRVNIVYNNYHVVKLILCLWDVIMSKMRWIEVMKHEESMNGQFECMTIVVNKSMIHNIICDCIKLFSIYNYRKSIWSLSGAQGHPGMMCKKWQGFFNWWQFCSPSSFLFLRDVLDNFIIIDMTIINLYIFYLLSFAFTNANNTFTHYLIIEIIFFSRPTLQYKMTWKTLKSTHIPYQNITTI